MSVLFSFWILDKNDFFHHLFWIQLLLLGRKIEIHFNSILFKGILPGFNRFDQFWNDKSLQPNGFMARGFQKTDVAWQIHFY